MAYVTIAEEAHLFAALLQRVARSVQQVQPALDELTFDDLSCWYSSATNARCACNTRRLVFQPGLFRPMQASEAAGLQLRKM